MFFWIHRIVVHFFSRIEEWWVATVALFMLYLIQQILVPHHSQVVEEKCHEKSDNDTNTSNNEDFIHSCQLFQQKVNQENEMDVALSKAWKFVEDLQILVQNFQNKDYLSSPPVFGNNDIIPHYEAMMRKIYKQHDTDKLLAMGSILKKYKVRIFIVLSVVYIV
ncbi:MAG: hypothetical protein ACI90V_001200 [Bacillariaceae sp.]|jgi:hypothetical protein